MDRSLNVILV